jgi:hypothetical protein
MKKTPALQQSLFHLSKREAATELPHNVQTAPLKPLVMALLSDLVATERLIAAAQCPKDEVKS